MAAVAAWMLVGQPAAPATVADYVQITNFADSAAAPAISPDGTMVAFIRDDAPFLSARNIYVKRLPNGEAKQDSHRFHRRVQYAGAGTGLDVRKGNAHEKISARDLRSRVDIAPFTTTAPTSRKPTRTRQ